MQNTEIDWKNLDEPKAVFIFEQAKDYLEKTLYASDQLDNKAFILLGFSITFLTGTIGYILSQGISIGWLMLPLLAYALSLFVACVLLKSAIQPTKYHGTGNLPDAFLNTYILEQEHKYIVAGEAQNYANRCNDNNEANVGKRKKIDRALFILVFSPFIIFIICLALAYLF